MRDDIRRALDIGPSATLAERTVDITTIGRRSGTERRIEICFRGDLDEWVANSPIARVALVDEARSALGRPAVQLSMARNPEPAVRERPVPTPRRRQTT